MKVDIFDVGQVVTLSFGLTSDSPTNAVIVNKHEDEYGLLPTYDIITWFSYNTGDIGGYILIENMAVWRYIWTPPTKYEYPHGFPFSWFLKMVGELYDDGHEYIGEGVNIKLDDLFYYKRKIKKLEKVYLL